MEREKFLGQILAKPNTFTTLSSVIVLDDKSSIEAFDITRILNLDKSRFSELAISTLEVLENDKDFPLRESYLTFKWKVLSLVNIQDIFPMTIPSKDVEDEYNAFSFFAQFYFYYESIHLLREYFYCGFNNFLSAAQHLLRTIIEFNIKQCYYYVKSNNENSMRTLNKYLMDGVSPSNQKMIDYYLSESSLAKPLKKKIQLVLKNLSNTSSHAYKPFDSYRRNGNMNHEYTIDTLMFWYTFNNLISVILWSYYSVFPMLFFPKDIIRRFGFNFPLGIFIDEFQYTSIKNSLDSTDLELFTTFALSTKDVENYNHFYNSYNDLTNEQIKTTWDGKDSLTSFKNGYIMKIAEARCYKEALANQCTFDAQLSKYTDYEPLIEKIDKFHWWKINYKKL